MNTQIKIELPPTVEVDQIFPMKITTDQASTLTISLSNVFTGASHAYEPTRKGMEALDDAAFAAGMVRPTEGPAGEKSPETTTKVSGQATK